MTSGEAMDLVASIARHLSYAREMVKRHPDNRYYLAIRAHWEKEYAAAVRQYTDPFGVKTYA